MIPSELKETAQWLVSGSDKIPVSPKTGRHADVRDRSLYVTYDEAVAYATHFGLDIGFALTPDDPFCVIDLDATDDPEQQARHQSIYENFLTYAELSRSQRGVHIWMQGSIPRGVRRDKVELYSADRYMITTGLALRPGKGVNDCQHMLDILFREMARGEVQLADLEEGNEILSDADLVEMASDAVNGDKFDALCAGAWQGEYPSQSEADYALMNMLCFYTRSNDQCRRIFRMSALGKRDKAQRDDYLNRMIRKIRAEEAAPVDFSNLLAQPVRVTRDNVIPFPVPENPAVPDVPVQEFTFPPGFMGEIAEYIYSSSTRPVMEVATAAAIAMTAGIVGRQFNVSGTGLNQYLILLAKTGVGKEDGARGIERIFSEVRKSVPACDTFVGPGTFASGQAIIRKLDEQPCFFSVLGEFGYTLQELSDLYPNSLSRVMRRVLLDLYTKSGQASMLASSAYSDKEKNTKTLYAPALTLFGESTPEGFYEGLSLHHVESGLVPRFLIIEYQGDRSKKNKNAFAPPPPALAQRMADLCEIALRLTANNTWAEVSFDAEATALLDSFDKECDAHIRAGGNEAIRQLWNRGHLKALRLAALLSVVDRPHTPVVNATEAEWAIDLVRADVVRLSARFEAGDIGEGDSKQMADLERIIKEYRKRPYGDLKKYGVSEEMHAAGIVPISYLMRRCLPLAAFRRDKRGATGALRAAVQSLVEMDKLRQVPKMVASQQHGTTAVLYSITV